MRDKVLIVDGVEADRESLVQILSKDYIILEAGDGELALESIDMCSDDLAAVLLKLAIPKVDGFKVLEVMNEQKLIGKVPVLIIGAAGSEDVEDKCFRMGVFDFIRKPFNDKLLRHRVRNASQLFQQQINLQDKVVAQNKAVRKQYQLLQRQTKEMEKNKLDMMDVFGAVAEYRNVENTAHIRHVKDITKILAEEMAKLYPEYKLDEHKIRVIVAVSALHDIGKIAIRENILLKPSKLTEEEFEFTKSHTTKGCDILNTIHGSWNEEYAQAAMEVCRWHHERFDGQGYPDGLKGEEIPISAQLVSLADVYDALISDRVYKKAYTKEQAYHMITVGECGVFSPKLMDCFHNTKAKIEAAVAEEESE